MKTYIEVTLKLVSKEANEPIEEFCTSPTDWGEGWIMKEKNDDFKNIGVRDDLFLIQDVINIYIYIYIRNKYLEKTSVLIWRGRRSLGYGNKYLIL